MAVSQEILFAKTLEEVRKLAKDQGGFVEKEQVEEAFERLHFDEGQMALVYDYLNQHKIGIGSPVNLDDYLTGEEMDYLEEYRKELAFLPTLSAGEKEACTLSAMAGDPDAQQMLIRVYLPEVMEIAKLYTGQGVYLEDLIGEGNVALTIGVTMLGALENAAEAEGALMKMVMDAMEESIGEQLEASRQDKKMEDKVNKVAKKAEELSGELKRKVTVEELAAETGMSRKYIEDALRLSGDGIEGIERG